MPLLTSSIRHCAYMEILCNDLATNSSTAQHSTIIIMNRKRAQWESSKAHSVDRAAASSSTSQHCQEDQRKEVSKLSVASIQ